MRPRPRPTLLWATLLALGACGRPDAPPESGATDDRPLVVASIFPVGDLAAFLGGDAVRVEVLLPPRASPSTFEPTAREVARLSVGRAYLFVGGGMDPWAEALVPGSGAPLVIHLSDGMELHGGHEHEGGETGNPHVWLDPVLVRDVLLPRLEEALVQVVPGAAPAIGERRQALADSLAALDAEIRGLLADVPSRAFVSTHAAWTYFAQRYALHEVGAVYGSPGREPSTRGLARLVVQAREAGVGAVFIEPQLGEAGARAVAEELGVEVRLLDPLGGPDLEGREGYLSLLRFNARQMAEALGGPG